MDGILSVDLAQLPHTAARGLLQSLALRNTRSKIEISFIGITDVDEGRVLSPWQSESAGWIRSV